MRKYHLFSIYGLIVILFGMVFLKNNKPDNPNQNYDEVLVQIPGEDEIKIMIPEPKVRLFELPEKISFSEEPVPLNKPDVRERFEREIYVNAYWQSNMILLMKRSAKFIPVIEKILIANGVPSDFKYVAMAESGLLNVVSSAGARGFWQFMPVTAKEYKLEISSDVDERYHLEKSTVAACKYLKSAYARFGSWTSVAASYNMGITGLSKRKSEQRLNDYYDLYLNEETSRYVFRILAFKEIFENPDKYGFQLTEKDYFENPLFREIKVSQSIPNLADWALQHNSNYKELKIHNPWLRATKLNVPKNRDYIIKLPV